MHTRSAAKTTVKHKHALAFSVYDSVHRIPVDDWNNAVNASDIFLSLEYLTVLESSQPAGLAFRYALIYDENIPVCVLAFQLLNVGDKELGGVLNLDDRGWLLQRMNDSINRILFSCKSDTPNYLICCGSLIVSGEHGISYRSKEAFHKAIKLIPAILEHIKTNIGKADICAWAVKDFFDISSVDQQLAANSFINLPMDPEMIFFVREEWNTFDDYLAALSAKYRLKANNAIKKLAGVEVRELSEKEVEAHQHTLVELYNNVQQRSTVRLMKVNAHYFVQLKKKLKGAYYIKGFFKNNKLVAFACGLVHVGHHEAHFIGIDYHHNKSLQLYQNILYLFIRDAIERRSKQLYFGRTAMEMKTTVGAKAYNLYSYFKLENGFLNKMIKPLLRRATPEVWTPRNPFKEIL